MVTLMVVGIVEVVMLVFGGAGGDLSCGGGDCGGIGCKVVVMVMTVVAGMMVFAAIQVFIGSGSDGGGGDVIDLGRFWGRGPRAMYRHNQPCHFHFNI